MKHLIKFNELNYSTYQNTARKLRKIGHSKRAEELEKHSLSIMVKDAEKYGVGECDLLGGFEGKFAGFDFGATHDMFLDSENEKLITIPVFFKIDGMKSNRGNDLFDVFNIEYWGDEGRISVIGWNEDDMYKVFKKPLLLFNNRRDANKLIMALRNINLDKEMDFGSRMNDEEFEEFKNIYSEMLNKLSPNLLWRGE